MKNWNKNIEKQQLQKYSTLRKFPHKVEVQYQDGIEKWLDDNIKIGFWKEDHKIYKTVAPNSWPKIQLVFCFNREEDAVAFKIVFSGE